MRSSRFFSAVLIAVLVSALAGGFFGNALLARQDDMRQHFQPLVDSLRSRTYSGLKLDSVVISGEDHLSVIGPAFVRGLRAVFRSGAPPPR